jgi:aquaporin Z
VEYVVSKQVMRNYAAEFIGTFALVFFGTGAIVVNQLSGGQIGHLGIALTFGLIVMGMIYALGNISGAHLNPAVTIAFAIAGRFSFKEVILGPLLTNSLAHLIRSSSVLFPRIFNV